jgi:hypothetical protein
LAPLVSASPLGLMPTNGDAAWIPKRNHDRRRRWITHCDTRNFGRFAGFTTSPLVGRTAPRLRRYISLPGPALLRDEGLVGTTSFESPASHNFDFVEDDRPAE